MKLQVFHANVNSLSLKFDLIQSGVFKADIFCFTESKLGPLIDDIDITIPEYYQPIRNDRNRHGGGIAVYVKTFLLYEIIKIPDALSLRCESIWLKIKLKNKVFILGCVYRQPRLPVGWWTDLSNVLEYLFNQYPNKDFIILGDFNEDLLNPNLNHLRDIIAKFGCIQLVDKPTRITPTSKTLLDPIITNNVNLISKWEVLDPLLSDHCAVQATLDYTIKYEPAYKRVVWQYDLGDYDGLRNHLRQVDWDEAIGNEPDSELLCTKFVSVINDASLLFVPNKIVTVRPRDKPWMNSEIRLLMRARLKAYRKARDSQNDNELWKTYNHIRNEVIKKIRIAKQLFLDKKSEKIKTSQINDKDWWKLMNEITKFKTTKRGIPALKSCVDPTVVITDAMLKAKELNKYFVSISTIHDNDIAVPAVTKRTQNSLPEISTNSLEILNILKNLQTNKAPGPDGVSNRILKETASIICEPLSYIFNRLLNEGYHPHCWKIAHVSAIPKSGLSNDAKNYRPISVTSNVGKILERVVFNHLIKFLNANSLIYKYQAGFLANHSTETQLIELYHNICAAVDKKQGIQFVFCDYSKAFDRVWHRGLFEKLKAHGINGVLLNWFKSYLSNRKQCVVLGTTKSDFLSPNAGVPQGSVLGPLLFLIYINDIQDIIDTNLRQFADDASAFHIYRSFQDVMTFLVPDLDSLHIWSKKWLMGFNPDKTEGLNICLIDQERHPIMFDNKEIKDVTTHKHLGLTFNNKATWSEQIKLMYDKALKKVGTMRSLRHSFDRKVLEILYFTYIRSGLEYASSVWTNCTLYESNQLETVQIEAARICTGLPKYCSLERLYSEIGWIPLETRRKIKKLILMYKIVNNIAPEYLTDLLPQTVGQRQNYQLRNNLNLTTYRTRTTLFSNSFFPSTICLWNNLEYEIRSSATLGQFVNKVKRKFKAEDPPKWYTHGQRNLNIILCRLRNNCSTLKSHLFRCNLEINSYCSCGNQDETTQHYFLECTKYIEQRRHLQNFLRTKNYNITIDLLLYGSQTLSHKDNTEIVNKVHKYIKDTGRFK
jgi:hypothetical protein